MDTSYQHKGVRRLNPQIAVRIQVIYASDPELLLFFFCFFFVLLGLALVLLSSLLGTFGLLHFEFASEQLDDSYISAITFAVTQLDDPAVAAIPICETRRDRIEHLFRDGFTQKI